MRPPAVPRRARLALALAASAALLALAASSAQAEIVFDRGDSVGGDLYAMGDDGSSPHLLVPAAALGMDGGLSQPAVAPGSALLLFTGTTLANHYVSPHGNDFYGVNADGTYALSGGRAERLSGPPRPARDPQGNPLASTTGDTGAEPAPGGAYVDQRNSCVEYDNAGFGVWTTGCSSELEQAPLGRGTAGARQFASECDSGTATVVDPSPDPTSSAPRVAYGGCETSPEDVFDDAKGELIVSGPGHQGATVVATGADYAGFRDPSWSANGASIVAFNEGGQIETYDSSTGFTDTPVPGGLYVYHPSGSGPGRLALKAPVSGQNEISGANTYERLGSPRFMGSGKIVFAAEGSVWTIPASCDGCTFPGDATKLYDGGSGSTRAYGVAWSSQAIAPLASPGAPSTTITKHPKRKVRAKHRKVEVRFKFTADQADATFACKLDRKRYKPCTSPYEHKVDKGKHVFNVRALSVAGAKGRAAKFKFKVKRKRHHRHGHHRHGADRAGSR